MQAELTKEPQDIEVGTRLFFVASSTDAVITKISVVWNPVLSKHEVEITAQCISSNPLVDLIEVIKFEKLQEYVQGGFIQWAV